VHNSQASLSFRTHVSTSSDEDEAAASLPVLYRTACTVMTPSLLASDDTSSSSPTTCEEDGPIHRQDHLITTPLTFHLVHSRHTLHPRFANEDFEIWLGKE